MTRTFILRLLGVLGLALGLSLAVTAGSASAQIAMGGPYGPTGTSSGQSQIQTRPDIFQPPYSAPGSQIQNTTDPGSQIQAGSQGGAEANGLSTTDYRNCGFWVRWDSYYTHCGPAYSIKIRVNFWYGANYRDIWVGRGTTNLSTHPYLQGAGMITNAWCIQNC